MRKKRRVEDPYRFGEVRAAPVVRGMVGDPKARIVRLVRRGKTACGTCGRVARSFYDRTVRRVRDLSCGDARVYLEFEVRRVACRRCGGVKREKLPWLAEG
jgi:transposase